MRNSKNEFLKIGLCFLIMFVTCFIQFDMNVYATEINSPKPIVLIDHYSVTEDKIVPGEDFVITLSLKNYSSSTSVDNLVVDINYPKGVAPEYGTTAQQFIPAIAPGEMKDVSFKFSSWTNIETESVDFSVSLLASNTTNGVILRIPCGSDTPFSILSVGMPSSAYATENVETALAFKVLGNENVSNVNVILSVNGEDVAASYIGIVTPGASKTQTTSITFDEPGDYQVDMRLSYNDSLGLKQSVLVNSQVITILQESLEETTKEDKIDSTVLENQPTNSGSNKLFIMGTCGILIILICFIIVALVYHKKR